MVVSGVWVGDSRWEDSTRSEKRQALLQENKPQHQDIHTHTPAPSHGWPRRLPPPASPHPPQRPRVPSTGEPSSLTRASLAFLLFRLPVSSSTATNFINPSRAPRCVVARFGERWQTQGVVPYQEHQSTHIL